MKYRQSTLGSPLYKIHMTIKKMRRVTSSALGICPVPTTNPPLLPLTLLIPSLLPVTKPFLNYFNKTTHYSPLKPNPFTLNNFSSLKPFLVTPTTLAPLNRALLP